MGIKDKITDYRSRERGKEARSKLKKRANKTIAFLFEDAGWEWPGLREAIRVLTELYQLDASMGRTKLALKCMELINAEGIQIPRGYITPWGRKTIDFAKKEKHAPSDEELRAFYDSWEWMKLSYEVRRKRGNRCECCGATARKFGVRIVADHIKPVRYYWNLRLDPNNIQVLCNDCNRGKSWRDETDWRHRAS